MPWLREEFAKHCSSIELLGIENSIEKASNICEEKYQDLPEDVRVGILAILVLIGKADGDFSEEEVTVVKALCQAMLISPKKLGIK